MGAFGNRSKSKLSECEKDLQKVMELAITRSKVDFGISEGHRSTDRQYQLFIEGKSKIDGKTKLGKHNYDPSQAVDIFAYHPDADVRKKIAYNSNTLCYIAGIVDSCAQELYAKCEISHLIRWGGNWDGDGIVLEDQSFDDMPHFELIKP